MDKQDVIRAVNLERKAEAEREFTDRVKRKIRMIKACRSESARQLNGAAGFEKELSEMEYQEPEDILIDDLLSPSG